MWLSSPKVLDAEFQALRLGDLAERNVLLQTARQASRAQHQVVALVLGVVLVVPVHRRTVVVQLIRRDGAAQRFCDWGRMHAEFGDKAAHVLGIAPERHIFRRWLASRLLAELSREIA